MRNVVLIALFACIAAQTQPAEDKADDSDIDLNNIDLEELMNTKEFQDKFAERFITKLFDRIGGQDLPANETISAEDLTNKFAEKFITKLYDRVLSTPGLLDAQLPEDESGHQMTQAEADQAAADAWVAAADAWATVAALASKEEPEDGYDERDQQDDYDALRQGEYGDHDEYDASNPSSEELAEESAEDPLSDITLPAAGLFGFCMGSALTLAQHFFRLRYGAKAANQEPLLAQVV